MAKTREMKVAPAADPYHEASQAHHNCALRHTWRRFYHDMYQRLGDEIAFSPGWWTDLWAIFSMEVRMPALIVTYFCFEAAFLLFFATLLWLTSGVTPADGFTRCLLASARSVTQLANWGPGQFAFLSQDVPESLTSAGTLILVLEGFLHFLFVCVASSLIIVRALRPLQQVAWSHHACLSDAELTMRVRILRPKTTVLVRPEVKLDVCLTSGTFVKLALKGDGTYAKWSGNPTITIRHVVDEGSPFFGGRDEPTPEERAAGEPGKVRSSLDGVTHVSCSFVATDANGTPISEVQQYTPFSGFMEMVYGQYVDAGAMTRAECPQILHHCKFEDQITFGLPKKEDLARANPRAWLYPHAGAPNMTLRDKDSCAPVPVKRLVTDSDTFCRIAPDGSHIAQQSSAVSTIIAGSAAAEQRNVERERRKSAARAAVAVQRDSGKSA